MKSVQHAVFAALAFALVMTSTGLAFASNALQSSAAVENDYVESQLLQPVGFSCSCHALDQQFEYICKNMSVGTTCARVGNIICYPTCQ